MYTMTKIVFLGTSCGMPTKERNTGGIAIKHEGLIYLFDCGEGCQKAMMQSKVSVQKVKAILISHSHADHFLGLPGLLSTMAMLDRTDDLDVYVPKNLKTQIQSYLSFMEHKPDFKINIKIIKPGKVLENKKEKFEIEAFKLNHSVLNYGFNFIKKAKTGVFNREKALKLGLKPGPDYKKLQNGESVKNSKGKLIKPEMVIDQIKAPKDKKISYVTDTRPGNYKSFLKDSSLLVHEGTYDSSLQDKAIEKKHSTATEAAEIAKEVNASQLVLISISPRYKDSSILEKEAKKIFKKTKAAKDLMSIEIK